MSEATRVCVTGFGMVSALGWTADAALDRLFAGERGVRALDLFHLEHARSTLAAEVVVPPNEPQASSRTDTFAVAAAREALAHAGLDPRAHGVDLVVGGTTAGMFETEELLVALDRDLEAALGQGERLRTHPLSSTADAIHHALGPFTATRTVCCACTSGAFAIALGAAWIRTGRAERVLAGGADALCRLTYAGFGCLGVLDPAPSRAFDRGRAGLNLGEGAGFLVLEAEHAARARGARVLVEVAGFGVGSEAHHITNPEPGGKTAAAIMRRALDDAGVLPADVGYLNAHGTGTPQNDSNETAAIHAAFGAHPILVSSSKPQIGHTLGAAGAIEAIVSSASLLRSEIPATIGLDAPEAGDTLAHVRTAARAPDLAVVASNSFGFGGTGATLVLARPAHAPGTRRSVARVLVTGASAIARGALLTGAELAALLVPGRASAPPGAAEATEATDHDATADLDPQRARRMDRAARLTTRAFEAALTHADARGRAPVSREAMAALACEAFGSVDGSMRFMRRILERGAKGASPADFPNLVPSSPVSHASIYLGLGGPAVATPDLNATAASSTLTAFELLASRTCGAALAGGAEAVNVLTERVLAPLLGVRSLAAQTEGASALVLETEEEAGKRAAHALAHVAFARSARGDLSAALADLPPPPARAAVVTEPGQRLTALGDSSWKSAPRLTVDARAGDHVGLSGVALAAAAAAIGEGSFDAILFVGRAPDRSYVFVLERVSPP